MCPVVPCPGAVVEGKLWCSTTATYSGQWGYCDWCPADPPFVNFSTWVQVNAWGIATAEVSWSGAVGPRDDDWLALYSDASTADHSYTDYFFATTSPNWQAGHGMITFTFQTVPGKAFAVHYFTEFGGKYF
eukprot:gene3058-3608_t